MKNVWEKYKIAIIIGAYLILLSALFRFALMPLNDAIRDKKKYAETQAIDRDVYEKRLRETPQLKEKIDSIASLREKLNVLVGDGSEIPLIESIERLALETSNDINLEIIEDGSKKKEEQKKSGSSDKEDKSIKSNLPSKDYILIRINLTGDFSNIVNFIGKVENLKYFSDIVSIKILKKEEIESPLISRGPVRETSFTQSNIISKKTTDIENTNRFYNPLDATLEIAFYLEKK